MDVWKRRRQKTHEGGVAPRITWCVYYAIKFKSIYIRLEDKVCCFKAYWGLYLEMMVFHQRQGNGCGRGAPGKMKCQSDGENDGADGTKSRHVQRKHQRMHQQTRDITSYSNFQVQRTKIVVLLSKCYLVANVTNCHVHSGDRQRERERKKNTHCSHIPYW